MSAETAVDLVQDPELLAQLSYRERQILTLRFVAALPDRKTVEEAAEIFDLTPGRLKAIENAALARLERLSRDEADLADATSTVRYVVGPGGRRHVLSFDSIGPNTTSYATVPDPENPTQLVELLCPPAPVGWRIESRSAPGKLPRWRHVRVEEA